MAKEGGRSHAPGKPELRRRPGDDEEGWLGDLRLLQALRGVLRVSLRRVPQRGTQIERQVLAAPVDGVAEDRLAVVEAAAHLEVLRSLPRKEEGHRVLTGRRGEGEDPL